MIAQFEPIAHGTYADGMAKVGNQTQYELNAYMMLDDYNFCKNCPTDGIVAGFPEGAEYVSYWGALLPLVGIIVFFRLLFLLILKSHDFGLG
jgi:hypothetical protein